MDVIKIEVEYRPFEDWECEALKKEAANIAGRALARTMIGAEPEPEEFVKDALEMKQISNRLSEIVKAKEEEKEPPKKPETSPIREVRDSGLN